MPIEVEVDGEIYEFPDDATEAEIHAALGGSSAAPSLEPMASHEPMQAEAPRTWGDEAIDVGKGVGKGLLRTGATLAGMFTGAPVSEFYRPVTSLTNTAQRAGALASDIGMSAVPLGAVAKATSAYPLVIRGLANAAAGSAVSAAQGNDPTAGALGAAAPLFVSSGVRAVVSRPIARALTGGSDDVADAALKYGALQGVVGKSGIQKAEERIGKEVAQAQKILGQPGLQRPIGIRLSQPGEVMRQSIPPLRRATGGAVREAEKAQADVMATLGRRSQSIPEFLRRSEASRVATKGMSAPKDIVERAAATDMRSAIGTAVPEVAPNMRVVSELAPVVESYANRAGHHGLIDPTGLPSLTTRLIAATVNRTAGTAARGANRTANVVEMPLARAALMSLLDEMRSRR